MQRLLDAKPCTKVRGCKVAVAFRPTIRRVSACLEELEWDRVVPLEIGVECYYLDERGVAHRTNSPHMLSVPIWICHTSRPDHRFLSKSGGVDYETYIHSDAWKRRADDARGAAGYRCQNPVCGVFTLDLHVHHLTYERLGREWEEDLQVLCAECHEREHTRVAS